MRAASFLPEWFWTETFWFPEEFTWDNFENYYNFSSVHELLYSIPLAFVYSVVQRGLDWFFFEPVAKLHGIETIQQFPPENPLLEKAFEISHKSNLNLVEIKRLSAEVNWTENQVKKWFRQRYIAEKGGLFKKFKESGWEFIFFCLMSIYGILCIWKKPWMWNADLCWTDFYTTKIPNDIWWYYMLELSFNIYLMVSLVTDVKRKDFWQMMCHHIITLLMIGLSFVYSAFRFGSLILLCHEIAHVPLQLSKVLKYLKYETGAILAFIVFVLVWFPSRLGYFPFVLIPSYINYSHLYAGNIYYLGCALQYALIVLHIIWSYMIIQIIIIVFNTKKLAKFLRYLKYETDVTFSSIVFVLIWFLSRLGYLLFVLIPSFNKNCHLYAGYICYLGYVLLYGLVVLHVIWSYMIIQSVNKVLIAGKVEDVRSESEDSD